jgi:hypothetical protein
MNSRVPWLHGHYPASALLRTPPPPSHLRSISRGTGYTTYLAPLVSQGDEEGFSSCSACPCSHAVAPTPPEWVSRVSQSTTPHAAFAFTVAGSASGAPYFRGHLCVRLRYGLETRPHPEDEAVERLQKVGFPSPCAPSYRALAFPLVGLPPTEHASLRWTHNRAYQSPGTRLKQSTYPKRRTDAVNLTVAVLMHQPEIREVIRAPMVLRHYVVHVYLLAIV